MYMKSPLVTLYTYPLLHKCRGWLRKTSKEPFKVGCRLIEVIRSLASSDVTKVVKSVMSSGVTKVVKSLVSPGATSLGGQELGKLQMTKDKGGLSLGTW